jgi:MOSC domain-containing protein
MGRSAGAVETLWRFPVKSMAGERVDRVDLTAGGIVGDRALAVVDTATGKVVSAKSVKLFPQILRCRAAFVEVPQPERELPPVRITLPDASTIMSDSSDADRVLSTFFKRDVKLARSAPPEFTIDEYHPDLDGADPAGGRGISVDQKLGSAFFAEAGKPSPVSVGAFFDLFPLSLVSTSTLARLSELRPTTRFDERRFRMNVIVRSTANGFPENTWVGRYVALGSGVHVRVAMPDPRCVMATLSQDGLPEDLDVLRTLTQHNRLQIGDLVLPCAGVYAVVAAQGTIRTGDEVVVAE